ncbi:uncharacterized protein LOC142230902 [Haematobia irritans]|uniref:uncharacterized protein LOC142230902 n=1 Tax=Haematobia irritans TaxID=7368 RepID=UPI003F4F59EB
MFALIETHIKENEIDRWGKYFQEFNLFWQAAKRNSAYGRASGGIVCGIKKSLRKEGITHKIKIEEEFILVEIESQRGGFTFIPVYIRGENWKNEFEKIKEVFQCVNYARIILAGDMNIRIGELQQNISEEMEIEFTAGKDYRKSKDDIVNDKGKQFIEFCEDNGLVVLNGRTEGDDEGHFTYISHLGSSVNDIAAVSYDTLSMVRRFQVNEKMWSDHLPIHIEIEISRNREISKPMNLLPKLKWKENERDSYKRTLNKNLKDAKYKNGLKNLTDLATIVQKSVRNSTSGIKSDKYRQIWFNHQCDTARKESFKCLNKYRKTSLLCDKATYLEAVKKYKVTCWERKLEFSKELQLKLSRTTNGKEWWKLAKQIRGQDKQVGMNISASDFKIYFDQLLNQPQTANSIQYAALYIRDEDLDKDIEVLEIVGMLERTKPNKAPGLDRIPYEFLKNAPNEFLTELATIYSRIFNAGEIDSTLQETVIFPIYKKGNIDIPRNYRGISFMNTMAKVLMGILNDRMSKWVNEKRLLHECQAGFRAGYSTIDNIYNLSAIVNLKLSERKKVFAFFVDFSAAFDMISRNLLLYKLHSMGLSTKIVNLIRCLYQNTKSVVWTGDELSEDFNTYTGVRQGCLLSPLLFTLYINDIYDCLKGGLMVDEVNIRVLLYADDIVLLADEKETLQDMIYNLERYCKQWNMLVNLEKSKIMIFRNGGRVTKEEKWTYLNQNIEIVNEFCYLGVIFTPKMSFTKHVEKRNASSKICINATWQGLINKPHVSLFSKWKIFKSVCRSTQAYAAQVWGYAWFEEVDKLQRYFLKRILKQPNFIPNYILSLETDIVDNHFYTLKLHSNYIFDTIFKYENTRLPHILSLKVWSKRVFWVTAMESLARKVNIIMNEDLIRSEHEWRTTMNLMDHKLKCLSYAQMREKAHSSGGRYYRFLNPDAGVDYMKDIGNIEKSSLLMRTRADILPLNANKYNNPESMQCSLCNTGEVENLKHFITCPLLREIRMYNFGKSYLEENELVSILNGEFENGWDRLYDYISYALKYRNYIMNENF